jgi:hypothetical protein
MLQVTRILALTLPLLVVALTASAQAPNGGTIGLYLDDGNDLSRAGITKVGEPFEIVVKTNSPSRTSALLCAVTELNLLHPGVFKVTTWKHNDSTLDMGNNDLGQYLIAYGVCAPAGELEVLRIGYVDFDDELPNDIALYVHGEVEERIAEPSLGGLPGTVDCDEDLILALSPEPWEDDSIDPTQIEGVTTTDGLLVLNPSQSVDVEGASMSTLKSRFRNADEGKE